MMVIKKQRFALKIFGEFKLFSPKTPRCKTLGRQKFLHLVNHEPFLSFREFYNVPMNTLGDIKLLSQEAQGTVTIFG